MRDAVLSLMVLILLLVAIPFAILATIDGLKHLFCLRANAPRSQAVSLVVFCAAVYAIGCLIQAILREPVPYFPLKLMGLLAIVWFK